MRTLAPILVALMLVACGSAEPAACALGRVTACACPGGSQGAQECGPGGVWSACVCAAADAGADVAQMPTDTPQEAAAPDVAAADVALDTGCPAHADRLPSGGCACVIGYRSCAGVCVDIDADPTNCGTCGNRCAGACVAGRCAVVDAGADVADVTCASMTPGNCCGIACNTPHAVGACLGGRCSVASCETGFGNCDGDAANGCEVDVASSALNCGACGAPCTTGRVCRGSMCVVPCTGSFADCNNNAVDGCEVDLASSVANCGACGMRCGGGQSCAIGRCR